jgi:predicted enzyme related to lactoylglutathione lyase
MSGPAKTGILFYAHDIAKVSSFYKQLLSATLVHSDDEHHVLESPDVQLIIYRMPKPYLNQVVIEIPPIPREEQAIKPFFTVDNLASAEHLVREAGGLVWGPVWSVLGINVRNVCDPEGNIVHLREINTTPPSH